MFADLIFLLHQIPSTIQTSTLAFPASLIVGLHYLGKRHQPKPAVYYDVRRQDRLAAQENVSPNFSRFMAFLGFLVAGISFAYLAWPDQARFYAETGLQMFQQAAGNFGA